MADIPVRRGDRAAPRQLSARLRRMVTEARSPDGAVRARMRFGRPPTVELDPSAVRRRTADDLAAAIEETLGDLLAGYRDRLGDLTGRPSDEDERERDDSPVGRRRRRLDEEIAEFHTRVRSPRTLVVIDWQGSTDLAVMLRDDALDRVSTYELTAEINSALATATGQYAGFIKNLYRRTFSHDRFAKNGN